MTDKFLAASRKRSQAKAAVNRDNGVSFWRVPISSKRLINLEQTLNNDRESKKIFHLLLKYRVLYFVNISLDYLNKFYNANRVWEYEARRHSVGLRYRGQTVKNRLDAIGDSDRHSDDTPYRNISL